MKDIQSQADHRRINIKKVGVKTISYPITVLDKASNRQSTLATVNMYVNLPHRFKGTHMSRFIEILNRFRGEIDLNSFRSILEEMKERLEAEAAHIEISFPYFLKKKHHPETLNGYGYQCSMHGSLQQTDDFELQFSVPVFLPLLKPVDEALPRSMGHWGMVFVRVRFQHFIWIEDLIMLVEQGIATQRQNVVNKLQPILSVEALTLLLSKKLAELAAVKWFSVMVENPAHGYSTFAAIEQPNLDRDI